MMHLRYLVVPVMFWAVAGLSHAQNDPDADIESEILNASINLQVNANDSVQLGTIIEPGEFGDVDILVTAISAAVDPGFDPDLEVTTLSGDFLAANDDWEEPEGNQVGFVHNVIRCYVQEGVIDPGSTDAVVLLSVSRGLPGGDTRIIADVRDVDGLAGRTVVSVLRVDGSLWDTHNCQDILPSDF